MKCIIGFFVVFLITLDLSGQEFRYLRSQDGLYDGEINSISQDSSGFMWFATWSGLISYDGTGFQLFRPEIGNPASLPDKKIKKIFIDSKDNHWIATSRNLCLYNPVSSSFIKINFDRNLPIIVDIQNLSEANDCLIIHAIEGLYYYPLDKIKDPDYKAQRLRVNVTTENRFYINYSTAFEGLVLLSSDTPTPGGSDLYLMKMDTSVMPAVLKTSKRIKAPSKVNAAQFVKSENNIYLATTDGIYVYSLSEGKFVKRHYFQGVDVRHIIYTANHRIYGSTANPELLYIDLHLGTTGSYISNPYNIGSVLNSNILALYEDFSGNLWVGHQGQGISIINLYLKEFHTSRIEPWMEKSLTSNTIMCFNSTETEVLIGCRTGGLNVTKKALDLLVMPEFDLVTFKQSDQNVVFRDGIWNIARETDSLFWVGTDIGLLKLVKSGGKWKFDLSEPPVYRGNVRKIFIDDNKNIWCGTWMDGLIFIPALKNNPSRPVYRFRNDPNDAESLTDNFVQSITLDSKGRFWVGTVAGFNLLTTNYHNLDLSGNGKPELKFKQYLPGKPGSGKLNNNEINCIFENSDGKIWVATQGGGINILDVETDSFLYLTTEDGLPSNDIQGILRDETGNLWISTNKGLAVYNQYQEKGEISVYNMSDGVQGEIFMVNSYYKSVDGEMFFGGDNGFTRFYPSLIKPNNITPKVAFTKLRFGSRVLEIGDTIHGRHVVEKSLNYTDKIKLPYSRNNFNIGVSALHFQNPEGNRISYKLEGYDNKWKTVLASRQFIYFTNLPSGKYRLLVKAINSDNVESEAARSLAIEIDPPWYQTWFMSIVFLIIGVGILAFLIFLIIKRQKRDYQKQIDKMAMENSESKMVFLTNVAHELRTPLSLVIAPIDDIIENYKTIEPVWKNHLQLIHRNSKYLLKLINQIVDFRKLNAGKLNLYLQNTDVIKLIQDVVHNFKYMESSSNVNLNLNLPNDRIIASVDIQKMEEVLYNLLSNAFKHTAENHTIEVSFRISESGPAKQIIITVFNEGKDISDEEKKKVFDRFYKSDDSIEGAGIGLSFSKSLVEMHHGSIDVESIVGRGVAFNVYLPYNESHEPTANIDEGGHKLIEQGIHEATESGLSNEQESGKEKNLKIAIVEDNDELRSFLASVLSRIYTCLEAKDGVEGWDIVKEALPDIVITDIIMPNMDGYQLCKQIKDNIKTCHIPVILLTAKNADSQIISGYNVGADAYITKPFDLNLILSQISRLIKNRELIREKYITQNFMVEVSNTNPTKDDEFIMNVRALLEENMSDPDFNVQKLSSQLNISTTQLYRKLKVLTGYSPVEFIRVIKLQKAYTLLNNRNNTVKEVCYMSGFNNLSYFIKCFREHFGVTPANYRDKGFAE